MSMPRSNSTPSSSLLRSSASRASSSHSASSPAADSLSAILAAEGDVVWAGRLPLIALLAASRLWRVVVTRNPGQHLDAVVSDRHRVLPLRRQRAVLGH